MTTYPTARVQVLEREPLPSVGTRALRGIGLGVALSLPLWGLIGLTIHTLWALMG